MGNTMDFSKKPTYQTFASTNPYATAFMSRFGSAYRLNPFLESQNKFIEQNVPNLYNQLLNPTAENPITQAKTRAFQKSLNTQSKLAFENNVINPLAERRMLRSSLVNDLTRNLQDSQTAQIANFNNEQLANASSDVQSIINLLMNQYKANANFGQQTLANAMSGANALNNFNSAGSSKSKSSDTGQEIQQAIKAAATIAALCMA